MPSKPSNPPSNDETHPTATQIIHTQSLTPTSLQGRVILITGCSSGIGVSTARALSLTGAKLFLCVRNIPKAQSALSDILSSDNSRDRIHLLHLDLANLSSIRSAVTEFHRRSAQLHILINNGGVMMTPEDMKTVDGNEMQFGTNHLGHFLLFALLRRTILSSVSPEFHCRVIGVTSSAHRGAVIPLGHMSRIGIDEEGLYSPRMAYGQRVHGLSVHPGGIFTGLQKHVSDEVMRRLREPEVTRFMKNEEQGAATTVLAAVGREYEGVGGVYLEDCRESEPITGSYRNVDAGFDERIRDRESAVRLWEISERSVGTQA